MFTAHLCFNRSYTIAHIVFRCEGMSLWVLMTPYDRNISAFHVQGQSIVRGSMGFQWINGIYLDCEHRLSETAFWNLLIMELVFKILLIMCISCELLIKQADIISLYLWELMIGATAFVIIWAFDCLNFWIQLCRECEETRYALCGLEVNMKLIGSMISIK